MRRIIAFNHMSADGYFTSADGKLDWTVTEEALDKSAAQNTNATGAMLFGRKTYEMFAAFWPNAIKDGSTAQDPHAPGRQSEGLHRMAVWINEAEKIVYSKTLKDVTWKGSRLLRAFDPAEVVDMKQASGKDIMIFGSGSIASLLTEHRLIDEYRFVVSPVLLGAGRSLLTGVSSYMKLELVEATSYPSGVVVQHYKPK